VEGNWILVGIESGLVLVRVLRMIDLDRLLFIVVVVVELTLKSGQARNLVILWSFDWGFSRISG